MFTLRVSKSEFFDRLNAEAYAPKYVECTKKLNQSNLRLCTLGEIVSKKINNSIRGISGELDVTGASIPMFRPADISSGIASVETAPKLTQEFENIHKKSRVYPGDIVLGIAGSVGVVGRVPVNVSFGNINGSSARISTGNDSLSAFLLAYLYSEYGQSSLLRYGVGSVQKHLNLEDLPNLAVAIPNELTQKYIGNKVRQAERLRAWAKNIEEIVNQYHFNLIPPQKALNFERKTRSVPTDKMTDRMDAHFYPAVVDDYLKSSSVNFELLNNLCSSIFNGQTQPETINEYCEQITVTNLSSMFISGQPRKVEKPSDNKRFLKPHDILLCNAAHNKTYIGRHITYNHSEKLILPSTEVMVIRAESDLVPASYLRSYLLTKLGYVQLQSTIRGITAHSYPTDVKQLDIPIPKISGEARDDWFDCDKKMVAAGFATELSTVLISSAKLLVEALIEGKITEQDLTYAQQALDKGDNSLDLNILSRLTTTDIDEEGDPLFPDLDQLYQLLEQANNPDSEV